MIDFKELSEEIAGEHLEALARTIGLAMGIVVSWSGRGADRGKDLIFTEYLKGQLSEVSKKWLVQCKDRANSNKSIGEKECGEILDKVKQHQCDGFLLVTTTTAGTALKAKLDSLDIASDGPIHTLVWDKYHLDILLRKAEYADIFKSFFPNSWDEEHNISIENAINRLKSELSPDYLDDLRRNVSELSHLSKGHHISPNDNKTASKVDDIIAFLTKEEYAKAVNIAEFLEAGVFSRLIQMLEQQKPGIRGEFLRQIIQQKKQTDFALNAFQILVDYEEISPAENIELCSYLDAFSLETLFGEDIHHYFQNEIYSNGSDYNFYSDIDQLPSRSTIEYASISFRRFYAPSSEQINFEGIIEFEIQIVYDKEIMGNPLNFPGKFEGFINCNGMFFSDITIDTSSFYDEPLT